MELQIWTPELEQWLAYAVLTGHANENVIAQSQGIPHGELIAYLDNLRKGPLAAVGSQFVQELAQLQWLLDTQTRLYQQSPYSEIPTLTSQDVEVVRRDFLFANRPVKISGLLDNWPARSWTLDNLRERWGQMAIEYTEHVERGPVTESVKHRSSFGQFLTLIEQPQNRGRFYWTAYNQVDPEGLIRELAQEVQDLPGLSLKQTEGNIYYWIGPAGTRSGLHFDPYNVLFAQVKGSKRFYLLPPSAIHRLYLFNDFFSPVDMEFPDTERYPKSAGLKPTVVDVHEGEVLLIPVGWFHQVTSLSFSASISLTNLDVPGGNAYTPPSAYQGNL